MVELLVAMMLKCGWVATMPPPEPMLPGVHYRPVSLDHPEVEWGDPHPADIADALDMLPPCRLEALETQTGTVFVCAHRRP